MNVMNDQKRYPLQRQHQNQASLLKHIARVLLMYRWTWISVTALTVLAVTVAVFTLTPRYTAECMVMIEPAQLNITEFKDVYDPTMTQSGIRCSTMSTWRWSYF